MIFSCSSGRLRLSAWSSFWKMATSHLRTISCRASEATRKPWKGASRCRVFHQSLYRRCSNRYMQTHVQRSCCRDICSLSSRLHNGDRRWNRLERWPECGLNGKGRVVVSTRPFIIWWQLIPLSSLLGHTRLPSSLFSVPASRRSRCEDRWLLS